MVTITETFSSLDPARQDQILTAALKEFTGHGFEQASTNRIVKEAGISKGILFYYFKNKKKLFHYLIDLSEHFIKTEYIDKLDENITDFIEKLKQALEVKMRAINKNPHIFAFMGSLYLNQADLPEEMAARLIEGKMAANAKLYDNIDTSLFREDVAPDTIIKLIQWSLEGIEKEIVSGLRGKNLVSVDFGSWDLGELYDYLAVLKKIYYK